MRFPLENPRITVDVLGFREGNDSGRILPVIDLTGTYQGVFLIYCGAVFLAILAPLLIKPPKRRAGSYLSKREG